MHKKKITPTGALLYVFLTVVLVFMMIPFVWLLISSLRPNAGSCERSFYVGEDITEEDIKGEFKHGILKLFVPKKEAKAAVPERKFIAIEG